MKPKLTYNADCQCWESLAPRGHRFASGPHSLIEPVTATSAKAPVEWKRAAKIDLQARVAQDRIVPCDCGDCD